MHVGDVVAVLDGVEAELVGRAVDDAALDAAAGQPGREAVRVVVAAVAALGTRRSAELRAPDDDRLVEQAAALQVVEQGRDRLIDLAAIARVIRFEPAVRVPGAGPAVGAVEDLHEPDAALDQPPGRQTELAERLGRRVVQAVEPFRLGRFGGRN